MERAQLEWLHGRIRQYLPEFESTLDAHIADWDGDALSQYVLFDDVTDWLVSAFDEGRHDVVQRGLQMYLEVGNHPEDDVSDVTWQSLVDHVEALYADRRDFISVWPDALKALRIDWYARRQLAPPW